MSRRAIERERPTDVGNARRLVERHGQELRHVNAWGWLIWDGRRWLRDETGEVDRRAKATVKSIYQEALRARNPEQRQRLAKHAVASERRGAIANMIALAASEPEVVARPTDFDRDPWRLTVANGTLDLRTGELGPHERTDLITKLAHVAYDPTAEAPRFHQFLDEIFAGDAELITYVQRAVGYCLTGDTSEQCLFFLHGSGQNGKGALVRTLEALLGDYFRNADFSTFLERTNEQARDDIARLAGARLVAAEEDRGRYRRLAEGLVKSITGQDTIVARYLYQNSFEFRPAFKLMLVANHLPVITGTDYGIWRRIRLIPFTVRIPTPDKTLEPTLQGPELAGILRWAVDGCRDWVRRGLQIPGVISAATAAYRAESDVFGGFLEECFELDETAEVEMAKVRARYNAWCREQGIPEGERLSGNRLSRMLLDRGFKSRKDGYGHAWRQGLRLRMPADEESTNSTNSTSVTSFSSSESLTRKNRENGSNRSNRSNGVPADHHADLDYELIERAAIAAESDPSLGEEP